jgi:PAB-dependent poly(A)-specific ribonuclease subunit 2
VHRSPDFKDLKCMNFTSKGTREILIAGCQEQMFKVDVEKGTITDTVSLYDTACDNH